MYCIPDILHGEVQQQQQQRKSVGKPLKRVSNDRKWDKYTTNLSARRMATETNDNENGFEQHKIEERFWLLRTCCLVSSISSLINECRILQNG